MFTGTGREGLQVISTVSFEYCVYKTVNVYKNAHNSYHIYYTKTYKFVT